MTLTKNSQVDIHHHHRKHSIVLKTCTPLISVMLTAPIDNSDRLKKQKNVTVQSVRLTSNYKEGRI